MMKKEKPMRSVNDLINQSSQNRVWNQFTGNGTRHKKETTLTLGFLFQYSEKSFMTDWLTAFVAPLFSSKTKSTRSNYIALVIFFLHRFFIRYFHRKVSRRWRNVMWLMLINFFKEIFLDFLVLSMDKVLVD